MIAHCLMDCPECGGKQTATLKEYYYGVDPNTGYTDAGRILTCDACGTELRDTEIDRAYGRAV